MKDIVANNILVGLTLPTGIGLAFLNPFVGGAVVIFGALAQALKFYAEQQTARKKMDFDRDLLVSQEEIKFEHDKEKIRLSVIEQEKYNTQIDRLFQVVEEMKKIRIVQEQFTVQIANITQQQKYRSQMRMDDENI